MLADPDFRSGCECSSILDCHGENCSCLQDVDLEEEGDEVCYAYNEKGCLRNELLESRRPIYECHDGCKCGVECDNRVVQRGRTIPLDIFKTDDGRGWGLFSPSHSPLLIEFYHVGILLTRICN